NLASKLTESLKSKTSDSDVPQLVNENFEEIAKRDDIPEIQADKLPDLRMCFFFYMPDFFFFFENYKQYIFNLNICIADDKKKKDTAAKLLILCEQQHVLSGWPEPGVEDEDKKTLLKQVLELNREYPGGLIARELLEESAKGINPFQGYVPEIPDGEVVKFNSERFHSLEQRGLQEVFTLTNIF
ncbi:hypothetical protein RFI_15683, partial [Reticulomyxa filosa]